MGAGISVPFDRGSWYGRLAAANEDRAPRSPLRFRASSMIDAVGTCAGTSVRNTNTKVLLVIVRRIYHVNFTLMLVAWKDSMNRVVDVRLADKSSLRKTRTHRLHQATLISRRWLPALSVNLASGMA